MKTLFTSLITLFLAGIGSLIVTSVIDDPGPWFGLFTVGVSAMFLILLVVYCVMDCIDGAKQAVDNSNNHCGVCIPPKCPNCNEDVIDNSDGSYYCTKCNWQMDSGTGEIIYSGDPVKIDPVKAIDVQDKEAVLLHESGKISKVAI